MPKKTKFYFDMIGCRLNQAEIEAMAAALQARGFSVTTKAQEADYILVNTCCVTEKAGADSRKMLRHYQNISQAQVISTGCWSTLFEAEALSLLPDIQLVPNLNKDEFAQSFNLVGVDLPIDNTDAVKRPNLGNRQRTRAFIKVQDGCDNRCSYCATRLARGASRSLPAGQIINQLQGLESVGIQEAVFCGVQLGAWGKEHGENLAILLGKILEETTVPRLRLSSIEPWDIGPDLIKLWQNRRLMPHLHIPLQSGSAAILRAMQRPGSPEKYIALLEMIRRQVPEMGLSTDIIVGFPGETEADFEATVDLVLRAGFNRGHVFQFSPVAGTPAAKMPGQIQSQVKKDRSAHLRALIEDQRDNWNKRQLGKTVEVLFESCRQGLCRGLSPDFQKVTARSSARLDNQIRKVRLEALAGDGFSSELLARQGE